MLIYLLVVLLILIFRSHLQSLPIQVLREQTEIKYLRIVCCILVVIAALRGSSVGTDTISYIQEYEFLSAKTFKEIMEKKSDFPGFYFLSKLCSMLHFHVQVLFGIIEGIYIYSVYKFTKRFSEDKLYSILCFTMIDLYAFSMAGLKQTLAMAFVLLYYLALIDKKYILSIVLGIIAFFCHQASLVFLFGVVLYYFRTRKTYYWILGIIIIIVLFNLHFTWLYFINTIKSEHYLELYAGDEGYSNTSLIYYAILVAILFLFSSNYRKLKTEESRVMIGLSTIAPVCQSFALVSSAAFRLSYFFLPFMFVGLANSFEQINNNDLRKVVKIMVASIVIFFFIYANRNGGSVVPYKFFWQE